MKMKLTLDGIKDKKSWEAAGVVLPSYDIEKVKEETKNIKKPSFAMAMLPIIVPIIMIIINTVANSVLGEAEPEIFKFIGDKTTALLAGAIVAYLIAVRSMGQKAAEKAATDSLSSAGIVFLITGAGGAFSNIITITGVSDAISDIVSGLTTNVFVVIHCPIYPYQAPKAIRLLMDGQCVFYLPPSMLQFFSK
mgnify:CR=1 FL=1